MKRRTGLFLALVCGVLGLVSCGKSKECTCTVQHDQVIRVIEIDRGDCMDIRFVYYDRDVLQVDLTDSVLCTDYSFE